VVGRGGGDEERGGDRRRADQERSREDLAAAAPGEPLVLPAGIELGAALIPVAIGFARLGHPERRSW
jgi:hypothetical protein